ncbi:MAG TPA: hypothetical protein VMV49_08505 [Candidatus Deferrimicrobium sp.]|nr:hypothetical protein [Candidatus Deferrimicrobium sp.]
MNNKEKLLNEALEKRNGVFRLTPTWVPREFCIPGRRLKLHPDDYYAFGISRGGIDERWFASTIKADNGPLTLPDEGLSYIFIESGTKGSKILLKDAIELMGSEIIGKKLMDKYNGWPMYAKFFDNLEPLPLHLHQNDEQAAEIGQKGKPEGYYFPRQLNNHPGYFPHTYFGLNPGTTKEQVKECIKNWDKGDNQILMLSKAYKLEVGTGWYVPPGILHAPGSLLTYEPQGASDVFAMFQNLTWNRYISKDLLLKNVPEKYKNNIDYIVNLIDWDSNLDPDFYANRFLKPKPIKPLDKMKEEGYEEYLIMYNSAHFSAKELIIYPQNSITIKEKGAYGLIMLQGYGTFGVLNIETPQLICFGEMTHDELFVTFKAATNGIEIINNSKRENLVMLKHFGPE